MIIAIHIKTLNHFLYFFFQDFSQIFFVVAPGFLSWLFELVIDKTENEIFGEFLLFNDVFGSIKWIHLVKIVEGLNGNRRFGNPIGPVYHIKSPTALGSQLVVVGKIEIARLWCCRTIGLENDIGGDSVYGF